MWVERQQLRPQHQSVGCVLEMTAQRAAQWLASPEAPAPQVPAMAYL